MSRPDEKASPDWQDLESTSHEPYVPNEKVKRKILRKVDIRLLPILGLLYTICLVDRANISIARISGIDQDLQLDVGSRASIILLVFFIGYIVFEIPSNIVIRKVGAANWITFITFAWGAVSIGIGFCNSWEVLAVLRTLLGALEAGFYPGCVYLIGAWYVRYEVQKRLAFFYLLAQGLAGFANILGYGIIQIARFTTYKGWRWIYIVEGSFTSLMGLVAWFIIIDFPDSKRNKFLTAEEKAIVLARIRDDRGNESGKVTWSVIGRTMCKWHVWSYSFIYMTGAIGSYAFTFFLPIILQQDLNFTQELAFILLAPPILFAVLEVWAISWFADRLKIRSPFLIFQALLAIVGLAITGFASSPGPR